VSSVASVAATAAGVALIALAARDVFDALFHPEGRSTLARMMMRGVWGLLAGGDASAEPLYSRALWG